MKNWMCSELVPENIIVCSKVSLRRNFKESFFDNKLSIEDGRENINKVYNALKDDLNFNNLKIVRLWEEENHTLNMYKEKSIISSELIENIEKAGAVFTEDGSLSILVNEEDNLRIQYISSGFSLKKSYKFANMADDIIEEHYSYAFHPKYGYLTTDLNNVGTGLKASVIVHLPAMTMKKEIKKLTQDLEDEGVSIEAVYKDKKGEYGNLYEISSKKTLGISEEARILSSTEALELLSNVMFGVEMSLIDINKDLLYRLIIESRDSVIKERFGGVLSKKEIEIERAVMISTMI